MEIKLDEEKIKLLIEKTQIYMRDEFDESVGQLKAGFLVDFFSSRKLALKFIIRPSAMPIHLCRIN